jgi:hypothetical protein
VTEGKDALESPFERGVNPWRMLGHLQMALIGGGTITAEKWDEAIEASIPTRHQDEAPHQEPCS